MVGNKVAKNTDMSFFTKDILRIMEQLLTGGATKKVVKKKVAKKAR